MNPFTFYVHIEIFLYTLTNTSVHLRICLYVQRFVYTLQVCVDISSLDENGLVHTFTNLCAHLQIPVQILSEINDVSVQDEL